MEIISLMPISVFLLLGSAALMAWHVHGWRNAQQSNLSDDELEFRRRQFRRRALTTLLMGLVAAALPFTVVVIKTWPKAGAVYVILLLLALVWIGLLALADIWSIRFYYGRLRDKHQLEQTRLAAELYRAEAARKNGHPPAFPGDNGRRNGNGHGGGLGPEAN